MFTKSLEPGAVSTNWKLANPTPLFKSNRHNLPTNYKPIAVLTSACKALEALVGDAFLIYLCAEKFLVPNMTFIEVARVQQTSCQLLIVGRGRLLITREWVLRIMILLKRSAALPCKLHHLNVRGILLQ
ncbi:hypothetical protein EG68_12379 [Paragonimus skrjabini miyazakii]|uniref:Uncharacterized protein n=1 Tax=Paragonimus skrjabini miyazakii TaxID=59628 RepID=A0A8S9YCV2_9TREM|nr:hypothetical protein EG68_12379 [Paragonimus skrjabini miyazakii]